MKNLLKKTEKTEQQKFKHISDTSQQLALPAAVICEDSFLKNLDMCCDLASQNGKKVRIATKSIRIPELLTMTKDRPEVIGFMTHDPWETLKLVEKGFKDLLLAYPVSSQKALKAIEKCYDKGEQVTIVADDIECLHLYKEWWNHEYPLRVCLDIDISFRQKLFHHTLHLGVRRSPTHAHHDFLEVYNEIKKHKKRLAFAGVMTYDAHLAALPDFNLNKAINSLGAQLFKFWAKKRVKEQRRHIYNATQPTHRSTLLWNGGGSGNLHQSMSDPYLTEVTVGSGLLKPHLFDNYKTTWGEPALFYALSVTRQPDKNIWTCHGGGHHASGPLDHDRHPLIVFPTNLKTLPAEGFGEVQTPILDSKNRLKKGDCVLLRPAKSGEFLQSMSRIFLIRKDQKEKKLKCLSF